MIGKRFAVTKKTYLAVVASSLIAAAAYTAPSSNPVAEIKNIEKKMEALYNSEEFYKNPASALEYFDVDQIRLFDITLPEEFRGQDFRKRLSEIAGQFQGKVEYVDMTVRADTHVAFVAYIQHFKGKDKSGKDFDMRLRTTDCFEKINGRWLIVHEHTSLPMTPAELGTVLSRKT